MKTSYRLVVLVPPHAADVVPGGGLVAEEALVYLRVLLTGDLHRDHLEVHHVVARRRLMALGARLVGGRGVAKFGDGPFLGGMALGAVGPEEAVVAVFGLVATDAVEQRFFAAELGLKRWAVGLFEPGDHGIAGGIVRGGGFFETPQADAGEGGVIHLGGEADAALVFAVALDARSDVGVEGAGLALEERLVVCVAYDAAIRLDAFDRGVAGGAVVFEKGVGGGKFAGRGHPLPG